MLYSMEILYFVSGIIVTSWVIKLFTSSDRRLGKLYRKHILIIFLGGFIGPIFGIALIVGLCYYIVYYITDTGWFDQPLFPLFPRRTKVKPYVNSKM